MHAEDQITMDLGSRPYPVLKPLRHPCIHMRSGLGRAQADFARRLHPVDMKQRDIGNS